MNTIGILIATIFSLFALYNAQAIAQPGAFDGESPMDYEDSFDEGSVTIYEDPFISERYYDEGLVITDRYYYAAPNETRRFRNPERHHGGRHRRHHRDRDGNALDRFPHDDARKFGREFRSTTGNPPFTTGSMPSTTTGGIPNRR
jgi:hypothetical protein